MRQLLYGDDEEHFLRIECGDGLYYAGYTNDLERRVRVHNEYKGAKYTRAKLPVRCIYNEGYETKRGYAGGV